MKVPYHVSPEVVSERNKVKKFYEQYSGTDKLPILNDDILFFLTGLSLTANEVTDRRSSERMLTEQRKNAYKLLKYFSKEHPTEIIFRNNKTQQSVTGDFLINTILAGALESASIVANIPTDIFVSYGVINAAQRKPLLMVIIEEYYLIVQLKRLKVPYHFLATLLNVSEPNLRQALRRAKKIVTHLPSK